MTKQSLTQHPVEKTVRGRLNVLSNAAGKETEKDILALLAEGNESDNASSNLHPPKFPALHRFTLWILALAWITLITLCYMQQ